MKQEYVKDWMTRNVLTVTPSTPLTQARRLMKQHRVRRLPVVEDDNLVGIITRNDIQDIDAPELKTLTVWDVHETLSHLLVKGEMTSNPITVRITDRLVEAARLMLQHGVGGLPVLDEHGKVVGIITESDIFRLVVKTWSD